MNVAILDPGYDHSHSHHQTVNLGLIEAFQERGLSHTLLASHALDEGLQESLRAKQVNAVAYFTTPTYPQNVETLSVEEHNALARSFADELVAAVDSGLVPQGSYLVAHTAYAFHVSGIAQAIYRFPEKAISGTYISLMFDPGSGAPQNHSAQAGQVFDIGRHVKYKTAFKLLSATTRARSLPAIVETSCESYRRAFNEISFGLPIGLNPVVNYQGPLSSPANTEPNTVLMYLGGPKENKGINFAAKVTEQLAAIHPELKLIFHFNHEFPWAEQFASAIEPLKNHGNDTIELVEGSITPELYDSLIARSAVMFVPYDPEHYYFKTSGVLWDGLRNPRMKWVVSDNTWVATELAETGKPHALVQYGDVDAAINAIVQSLSHSPEEYSTTPGQDAYTDSLLKKFGDHVGDLLLQAERPPPPLNAPAAVNKAERILVVRTQYGHFGALSGPGGFIPPLREKLGQIDDLMVRLGDDELQTESQESISSIWSATREYISSYQLNSIITEQQILSSRLQDYDVIHFLDTEHSGLLTALFSLTTSRWKGSTRPKIVATFHQPESILRDIIKDPSFLKGFDVIHVLSPCQEAYFRERTSANIVCIAHGIAPDLVDKYAKTDNIIDVSSSPPETDRPFTLLTTGNWLRDFDSLVATARLLESRDDLRFVVVSKGLELEEDLPSNVELLNQGISDSELHDLYETAGALFLPLHDGAANNAMLEAMAHGLPIVTTDLPSTRYYTDGLGVFCDRSPEDYAKKLLETLAIPKSNNASALKARAQQLHWHTIADEMLDKLYR